MTRLGFVGLGWIGRQRLASLVAAGAEPVAYLEPDEASLQTARATHDAVAVDDLDALLSHELDGVVVATPNALHAQQSRAALERGVPVFCQKPLAHRGDDARRVVGAAEEGDVLLEVDWSYRGASALQSVRDAVRGGAIGSCYHAELVFHNSYGPDKSWYRDAALAGGGCLLDLGCHLLDALQWIAPDAYAVASARTYAGGQPAGAGDVEDHAMASLTGRQRSAQLTCSWNAPSGGNASIGMTFYGTKGAVRMRNLDGSYDRFVAERLHADGSHQLAGPDEWAGRQAVTWARRLQRDRRFDPAAWSICDNVRLLEEVYACAS